MHYPKWKYHPEKSPVVVGCAEAEAELGSGWFESPAEFGVETCPGLAPDPVIAMAAEKFAKKEQKISPGAKKVKA